MIFSDLLQRTLRALGQIQVSTATGGTTTTVVDTKQIDRQEEDDVWKEGTLFIVRDTAGTAPQGEFQRISAYDDTTGTFTVDTVFSASPAIGDRYGFIDDIYPLHDMIEICNDALADLGDVPETDTTTIDTVANQTEYDYVVAWKRKPPLSIDFQGKTGDTNDNLWEGVPHYRLIPGTAGSASTLELVPQLTSGRDIRVVYMGTHTRLNDFDDVVSEFIFPGLAVAVCTLAAIDFQINTAGAGEELEQRYNKAADKLDRFMRSHRIWRPTRNQRILSWPQ